MKLSKGNVWIAGVATAAATVVVVGHMLVLDWVGDKLREHARAA